MAVLRDRSSLYHKACEIAMQNGFTKDGELFLFYFDGSPDYKLTIAPKPNNGLLICVEDTNDNAPIFLDQSGENLIEPIIDMIAFLIRKSDRLSQNC